jgi:hypothetical protein
LCPGATGKVIENVAWIEPWLPLDIDAEGWSQDRLDTTLGGVRRISYTTTKSRPEHQRWRVIVALLSMPVGFSPEVPVENSPLRCVIRLY